jgi:DNA primase
MNKIGKLKYINKLFLKYTHQNIYLPEHRDAVAYLLSRGITKESIDFFQIGVCGHNDTILCDRIIQDCKSKKISLKDLDDAYILKSNKNKSYHAFFDGRITFPIFNRKKEAVGFSARALPNLISANSAAPKYKASGNNKLFIKKDVIFNVQNLNNYDTAIVVEGGMDAITLNQMGYKNAISFMGVYFSHVQIETIKKMGVKKLILALDNDGPGAEATIKMAKKLIELGITPYVVNYEHLKGNDFNEQISKLYVTKKILHNLISYPMNYVDAHIKFLQNKKLKNVDDLACALYDVYDAITLIRTHKNLYSAHSVSTKAFFVKIQSLFTDIHYPIDLKQISDIYKRHVFLKKI